MPCYDPRSYEDSYQGLQDKIDRLTDLLCQAGRAYANRELPSLELRKWWVEHRQMDKERGEPW